VNAETVVIGEVFEGLGDLWVIAIGLDYGSLQVVRDQQPWHTADGFQTTGERIKEVFDGLSPDDLHKAVVRERQTGHEDLAIDHFTCIRVDIGDCITCKINIKHVGRLMIEDHRGLAGLFVLGEVVTKLGITITIRLLLTVFFPKNVLGYM